MSKPVSQHRPKPAVFHPESGGKTAGFYLTELALRF